MSEEIKLQQYIRSIPDWPKKGILFRDITPLLGSAQALALAIEKLAESFAEARIEYVAAVEARGFILGAAVARKLGAGFVPIRKKGKLPYKTESVTYDLEYGSDTIEMHSDAIRQGARVLLLDDLLATGGTMAAAADLVKKVGGQLVGIAFLIELRDLRGRDRLPDCPIEVLISY
ncbi:MAG: adenine phosphoribosyltransferase [Planctomycetota bacterium]